MESEESLQRSFDATCRKLFLFFANGHTEPAKSSTNFPDEAK
jgi:hypothetical protein